MEESDEKSGVNKQSGGWWEAANKKGEKALPREREREFPIVISSSIVMF